MPMREIVDVMLGTHSPFDSNLTPSSGQRAPRCIRVGAGGSMERLPLARRLSRPGFSILVALYAGGIATAQTLPRGQIVDDVQCVDDETQHYSVYLPSTFTPARRSKPMCWDSAFGLRFRTQAR